MPKSVQILLILAFAAVMFFLGHISAKRTEAVCHSITEDSDITDCSYENGTWRTK